MILGAVIDAGDPFEELTAALDKLHVKGFSLRYQKAQRGGVSGALVTVDLDEEGSRPRRWQDFVRMVEESELDPNIVQRSVAVFNRLAEAEAMVHGTTTEDVQLHELGELDTLVDVVGSIIGLDMLGIERLYSSPFPSGSGVVTSAHGMLPVPAPATAALFAMASAPVVPPPGNIADTGEMVTPTGAAILTTLATFQQPALKIHKIGYGLGSRESRHYPNALALWLGESVGGQYNTQLTMIDTNIDDMNGEMLGFVQERLFELGARDVWFTPIQMKKNRPATMLSAIVPADLESQAINIVMRETSTLGVRVQPLTRYEAEREFAEVETSLGVTTVKIKRLEEHSLVISPEYEECRRIALERKMPLQDVYRIIQHEATEQLSDL